jgi:hypothetical protein
MRRDAEPDLFTPERHRSTPDVSLAIGDNKMMNRKMIGDCREWRRQKQKTRR